MADGCPFRAVLSTSIAKCPFLSAVSERQGPDFAAAIAVDPTVPALSHQGLRRPVLEDLEAYSLTLARFHGPSGVVPLERFEYLGSVPAVKSPAVSEQSQHQLVPTSRGTLPLARAPLATISLSGGGVGDFFSRIHRAIQQHQQEQRRSQRPRPSNRRPPAPDPAPQGPAATPASSSTKSSGAQQGGGTCPMRKVLGPLAPLVFNPKGHLQCPEPIVRARAALAATQPVRELRPQALPVKLMAVGAFTAAVNVPFGAWREHCEKFSGSWFVAVHAAVPFIAMLRKAVIMPKYALIFTIAAAVAGQAIGARLERKRMLAARKVRLTTGPVAPRVALEDSYMASSTSSSTAAVRPLSRAAGSSSALATTEAATWQMSKSGKATSRQRRVSSSSASVGALMAPEHRAASRPAAGSGAVRGRPPPLALPPALPAVAVSS